MRLPRIQSAKPAKQTPLNERVKVESKSYTRKLTAMPFGKHKGVPIEEVPFDYLEFVIDNFDPNEKAEIYEMCEEEFIRRKVLR